MDIEFVAEDNLPEDSLIRHLVVDLFGKITLYPKGLKSFESQNLSAVIHLEIIPNTRYTMVVTLLTNPSVILTYKHKHLPIICKKLFGKCLNDIEQRYRSFYTIYLIYPSIRKYTLYQLLEGIMVGLNNDYYDKSFEGYWREFTINYYCPSNILEVKYNGNIIYKRFASRPASEIWKLMDMFDGTGPSEFYIEQPIVRMKSAIKNIAD
jgi:hypothetical protein